MQINYSDGESLELTPDNTYIISYDNDMMDGVMIDIDDNYAFISAHTPGYDSLLDELDEAGVGYYGVDGEVDWTEAPHSWVLQSVGRLVVRTAEDEL